MGIYANKKPKVSSRKKSSFIYNDLPIKSSKKYFWLEDNKNSKDAPDSKSSENRMKYLMEKYREIVHYNSPEPEKYGARAFTKNSEIYIAPGEEDSLDHELAHVYQQETKSIPATTEIDGQKVNLDPQFEQQADEMAEGKVKDLSLLKGKNRTKDIVQFDFDPKKPGEHQEERRDYYKDRLEVIKISGMPDTFAGYIDACKNVKQVSVILRIFLRKYWPDSVAKPTVNLDGMNLDLAKVNAKQLIRLLSKYSTSIHDIQFGDVGGRAGVSGEFEHTGGRTLKFSEDYFKDGNPIESTREDFAGGERRQIGGGNHAEVRTNEEKFAEEGEEAYVSGIEKLLKYTVTHEFGHSILSYAALFNKVKADSLESKSLDTIHRNIQRCIFQLCNKHLNKYGSEFSREEDRKPKRGARDSNFISEYAGYSEEEFIAESFAQAELSSNPESVSIYAKKLMEIIDTFFAWEPKVRPEDFDWDKFQDFLRGL